MHSYAFGLSHKSVLLNRNITLNYIPVQTTGSGLAPIRNVLIKYLWHADVYNKIYNNSTLQDPHILRRRCRYINLESDVFRVFRNTHTGHYASGLSLESGGGLS